MPQECPSATGLAPMPPLAKKICENYFIIVGAAIDGTHRLAAPAMTLSGTACASIHRWQRRGDVPSAAARSPAPDKLLRIVLRRGNRNRAVRAFIPRRIGIERTSPVCRIGVAYFITESKPR